MAGNDPAAGFVHLFEGDTADIADLRAWIQQSATLPGWPGF